MAATSATLEANPSSSLRLADTLTSLLRNPEADRSSQEGELARRLAAAVNCRAALKGELAAAAPAGAGGILQTSSTTVAVACW